MTLQERADAYATAFARFPASYLRVVQEQGEPCLYGTWLIGNDYRRKHHFYGEYPPSYVDRVMALFPDVDEDSVLHAFSGSVPAGRYLRLDSNPAHRPDLLGSVYDVRALLDQDYPDPRYSAQLVLADPPYSAADAEQYETAMVDRRRAMAALSEVVGVGRHLVWLDCVWPMHRKTEWRTVGRIALIRSTNHRIRLISIFERQAG